MDTRKLIIIPYQHVGVVTGYSEITDHSPEEYYWPNEKWCQKTLENFYLKDRIIALIEVKRCAFPIQSDRELANSADCLMDTYNYNKSKGNIRWWTLLSNNCFCSMRFMNYSLGTANLGQYT